MKKIEFIEDGYEIVIDILNADRGESILEADVYYKHFDFYKIYVLASNENILIHLAITELLNNHPFEKVIHSNEAQ